MNSIRPKPAQVSPLQEKSAPARARADFARTTLSFQITRSGVTTLFNRVTDTSQKPPTSSIFSQAEVHDDERRWAALRRTYAGQFT
jgi:hypothetical protein